MSLGEFDLIKRFFTRTTPKRDDVLIGIGDDCALLRITEPMLVAISTDSLVAGQHFLAEIDPADLAYKAFMVNLSDLAAMGAQPAWLSLALTLESIDTLWLQKFSDMLFQQLETYHMQLIGGDTTKGPLSLTLTIQGLIPKGQALTRSGAHCGDSIYVTGSLGDSAAGLAILLHQWQAADKQATHYLLQRHLRPTARIEVGSKLRGIASAAIDISDGLLSDLRHLVTASQCGAAIYLDNLPLSNELKRSATLQQAYHWAMAGGEDYELCFTVPASKQEALNEALTECGIAYHVIGTITDKVGELACYLANEPITIDKYGFDHFHESK